MITLLENKIDAIINEAKNGNASQQLKLAKCFYYGKYVKRNISLARYWLYKSIENGNCEAEGLYEVMFAPHFTGNEIYKSYGESYDNIKLSIGGFMSSKLRGKFDVCSSESKIYRCYYYVRFLFFYFGGTAYRVYQVGENSYKILGKEKGQCREKLRWRIANIVFLAFIIFLISGYM